jgi:hypothetical protein
MRKQENLKTKFKALVDAKKPTGETICEPWIRDAKLVSLSICKRAAHNAVVDRDWSDVASDNEL